MFIEIINTVPIENELNPIFSLFSKAPYQKNHRKMEEKNLGTFWLLVLKLPCIGA